MDLPGRRESCWMACAPQTDYPTFRKSASSDVAIVGAGIVGLTAAYHLASAGISVTVLEARKVGRQVTGRSTAKITSQHTLIYNYQVEKHGLETARLYADANQTAVREICRWVEAESIACDLERKDAYVYTSMPAGRAAIDAEAEVARRLGLEAEALSSAPLPFATSGALRFRNQAQFNPAQYLIGLAAAVTARGGRIFENARVTSVKPDKRWRVTAGRHHLDAENVVLATNLPIAGPIHFDELTQPRSHVAMAFRALPEGTIDGMFIGSDRPTHSLRMGRDTEGPLLVVLGAKIRGRANAWTELYDPERRVRKGFNRGGDTRSLVRNIAQIPPGQGGVVKRGKEKIAVWKSLDGTPHALSASCTHMGCTVTWNNADLTWDCPCHGSMFSRDGQVIHGPATEALSKKKIPSRNS